MLSFFFFWYLFLGLQPGLCTLPADQHGAGCTLALPWSPLCSIWEGHASSGMADRPIESPSPRRAETVQEPGRGHLVKSRPGTAAVIVLEWAVPTRTGLEQSSSSSSSLHSVCLSSEWVTAEGRGGGWAPPATSSVSPSTPPSLCLLQPPLELCRKQYEHPGELCEGTMAHISPLF